MNSSELTASATATATVVCNQIKHTYKSTHEKKTIAQATQWKVEGNRNEHRFRLTFGHNIFFAASATTAASLYIFFRVCFFLLLFMFIPL